MAEVPGGEGGGGGGRHQKKRAKKGSTRIDMTPMVDLGFLLITFFIFTATMSSPTTMNLNVPKDTKDETKQNEIKQSGALTILLGKGDQVYYYEGQLTQENASSIFKQTPFSGIRKVIIDKRNEVMAAHQHDATCAETQQKAKAAGDPDWQNACLDRDLVVVIKPDPEATYKNTVDILDEMTINKIKRFAMVKISPTELDLVHVTEANNPNLK